MTKAKASQKMNCGAFLHSYEGNTAQLKLRRFAEILCPDFVAISR